jgi:hypothetical protein
MPEFNINPFKEAFDEAVESTGLAGHQILYDGLTPRTSSSEGSTQAKHTLLGKDTKHSLPL